MANIPLSLTCAPYHRVLPLAAGDVRAEGIDLTLVRGDAATWKVRAEMLRRALNDPSVQGGEGSMGQHLRRIDQGDRRFVALPVFVLRNFPARDLYVARGSSLKIEGKQGAALNGKRIGMYAWTASGSIWYRHFLRWLGTDLDSIKWCIGDIDASYGGTRDASLPAHVSSPTPGKSLAQMLQAGELDAIYSPPVPKDYGANGPIMRLVPDYRGMELAYFKETGCYPPQHLIVLRRAAWEANPWIAHSLTDAFVAADRAFHQGLLSFPYDTPWQVADVEAADAALGPDFHEDGLDRNRRVMEEFCAAGHRAGLTDKLVAVDDYFAEYLASPRAKG